MKEGLELKAITLAQMHKYDEARTAINTSKIFDASSTYEAQNKAEDKIDLIKRIESVIDKNGGGNKKDNKPPAENPADKTANFFADIPEGKSQRERATPADKGNNVRNVTITIQRIVGAEVVNIYGTDPNLTGLQRMVQQHTTEAIVRGTRDTEIVVANQ